MTLAACGGQAPHQDQAALLSPRITVVVEGYPLDRSLAAFAATENLTDVLVVRDIAVGEAHWTTPDGTPPAYIVEGRGATEAELTAGGTIVTPVTATVVRSVVGGESKGNQVTFDVTGGQVGDIAVRASDEVAPDIRQLDGVKTAVLAGVANSVGAIDLRFLYGLDGDGKTLRSLLASATSAQPIFSIDEMDAAFAAKSR
jgi:hypothetical protein